MAKSADSIVHALSYLIEPAPHTARPVIALVGDEGFLRHEVRQTLRRCLQVTFGEEVEFVCFDGRSAELRDVLDALHEKSLFGASTSVVVVEDADAFVKLHRERLEQYVEQPAHDAVLILEPTTWPANTRLAKAVAKGGLTIRCQVPQQGRELTTFTKELKDWLIAMARQQQGVELQRGAVDLLLDLLPTEVGVLYQEVAKLSLLVDKRNVIDAALVGEHVGGWRTRKTWDMIDAAADGRAADALGQLGLLLASGEEAHALLPQMASTMRKFAAAVRLFEVAERRGRGISLRTALERAGMPPFKLNSAEQQLRQIGRSRARQLYAWLLAADLGLKDYNSTKDRARRVLETLIIRLTKRPAPANSSH